MKEAVKRDIESEHGLTKELWERLFGPHSDDSPSYWGEESPDQTQFDFVSGWPDGLHRYIRPEGSPRLSFSQMSDLIENGNIDFLILIRVLAFDIGSRFRKYRNSRYGMQLFAGLWMPERENADFKRARILPLTLCVAAAVVYADVFFAAKLVLTMAPPKLVIQ